jgi:hypothetical protein
VVAVLFNFVPQTLKMGMQEYLIIKLSFKNGAIPFFLKEANAFYIQ